MLSVNSRSSFHTAIVFRIPGVAKDGKGRQLLRVFEQPRLCKVGASGRCLSCRVVELAAVVT